MVAGRRRLVSANYKSMCWKDTKNIPHADLKSIPCCLIRKIQPHFLFLCTKKRMKKKRNLEFSTFGQNDVLRSLFR